METGLGWGADDNWLEDTAQTVIGTLSVSSGGSGCPEAYDGFVIGYYGISPVTVTQVSGTAPVYCGSFKVGGNAWTPLLFSTQPFTFTQTGGNGIGDWGLVSGWYAKEIYGNSGEYFANVPVYITDTSDNLHENAIAYLTTYGGDMCPEAYVGIIIGHSGGQDFVVTGLINSEPVYCGSFWVYNEAWTPLLFSRAPFTFTQSGGNGIGDWGLVDGWYAKEIYGLAGPDPSYVAVYRQIGSTNLHSNAVAYLSNLIPGQTTTVDFVKSTSGYSVVCMCKWITSYGGDVYCSPILISSQPNNTLYTRDGSSPSVNNTEHQYQGMAFYMRKAPLDILDGTETIASDYPIVDLSGVAQTNDTIFTAIAYQSGLYVGYEPGEEDPYAPGGTSGPGGGTDTDFDITGDTILDSPLPTFSFANSGFARIYNPDLTQLQTLANYLWTDTNFLQTIVNHAKQLLEDPIESIITLNRLPISVPNGTAEVVKVLYIPTNTSMPPVTNQFVDVDCGTLQIKHEYDSALDYNPYTDISLVLPFIGVVQLDPDEVMDKTLSLTYRVDVVSGMCVAKVAVDGCVLYQYSGNCAISMPFNSADFSNYISAMVTAAKSIAGVAAAGAAGTVAAAAEGTESVKAIVAKATSGEPETELPSLSSNKSTNVIKETFGKGGIGEGTLKAAKKGVANTVSAVVSSKRTIEHAGHFSGNSGFLGVRRPYAIIKRPRMCNPDEYGKFNGRPCMMYLYLGNLSGYTEVQEIHLTGILATNDELVEIENLLKSGVIM